MPTFIEKLFVTNSSTLSATILEYAPTALQKEVTVEVPEIFQTQAVVEPIVVEDTSAKEEAEAKAKKSEWLRMYFLGYI